jgi:hypothetical protein
VSVHYYKSNCFHFYCLKWHTGKPTGPVNWCTGVKFLLQLRTAIAIRGVPDATVIQQSHQIWGYTTDVWEGVRATRKKAMVDASPAPPRPPPTPRHEPPLAAPPLPRCRAPARPDAALRAVRLPPAEENERERRMERRTSG